MLELLNGTVDGSFLVSDIKLSDLSTVTVTDVLDLEGNGKCISILDAVGGYL